MKAIVQVLLLSVSLFAYVGCGTQAPPLPPGNQPPGQQPPGQRQPVQPPQSGEGCYSNETCQIPGEVCGVDLGKCSAPPGSGKDFAPAVCYSTCQKGHMSVHIVDFGIKPIKDKSGDYFITVKVRYKNTGDVTYTGISLPSMVLYHVENNRNGGRIVVPVMPSKDSFTGTVKPGEDLTVLYEGTGNYKALASVSRASFPCGEDILMGSHQYVKYKADGASQSLVIPNVTLRKKLGCE